MWILAMIIITLFSFGNTSNKSIVHEKLEAIHFRRNNPQNEMNSISYFYKNNDKTKPKNFVYINDYTDLFIKNNADSTIQENYIKTVEPQDHPMKNEGSNESPISLIIIILFIILVVFIIIVIIYFICYKKNSGEEDEIQTNEEDIKRKETQKIQKQKSKILLRESKKINPDKSIMKQNIIDLASIKEENLVISKKLTEEEKKNYTEEVAEAFSTAMPGLNENTDDKSLEIFCSYKNPYLHPSRTMFYTFVKEHINEFKRIESNYDLNENKKEQEIENLMKENLIDFLCNISKVLKEIKPKLQIVISSFITRLKDYNVETVVCDMWRSEDFGLFEICNAAILTDLYYAVVDTNVIPEFMRHANFDRSIKGLRKRIEILAYYCSCLCYLCSHNGKIRGYDAELFRGIKFRTDNKYKNGEYYRFITYQSCSTDFNIAAKFMDGVEYAIYIINLPSYCENGFIIQDYSRKNVEYLINPFTCFKLNNISNEFKYKNIKGVLEDTKNAIKDAICYEMTIDKECFYQENNNYEYFEPHPLIKFN